MSDVIRSVDDMTDEEVLAADRIFAAHFGSGMRLCDAVKLAANREVQVDNIGRFMAEFGRRARQIQPEEAEPEAELIDDGLEDQQRIAEILGTR